jgi:precorrin-6x reductase
MRMRSHQVMQLAQLQLIPYDAVERTRPLGRGTYATVHLGTWRGAAVAIKQLHQDVFEGAHGRQELAVRAYTFRIAVSASKFTGVNLERRKACLLPEG